MPKIKTLLSSSILLRDEVRAILHLSSSRTLGITSLVDDLYYQNVLPIGTTGLLEKEQEVLFFGLCQKIFG